MALAHLGESLFRALTRVLSAPVVGDKVLAVCLNDVSRALLLADVRFETVRAMQISIRSAVSRQSLLGTPSSRYHAIKQAVEAELRRMLDPGGKSSLAPTRGKKPASVVMLVGLEGSGKTTTCVKYADYHRRQGFSPALVCADDTFRAGDQLDQLRLSAGIPFYGSYTESEPVNKVVDRFRRQDGCDLIVVDVDTTTLPLPLLEEMRQATQPDLVVLVMDASIGKAALDQVLAFASVGVGAVIVTKMDAHNNGAGALSAVAATKSPVIFIGTGEHVADLEAFDASSFVRRLLVLGMGRLSQGALIGGGCCSWSDSRRRPTRCGRRGS